MRSAASHTPWTLVALACRGVRMPAASIACFMRSLSRNGTVCATVRPGSPNDSRIRAARIMYGSQRHSTCSIRACRARPCRAASTAFSSASDTCS